MMQHELKISIKLKVKNFEPRSRTNSKDKNDLENLGQWTNKCYHN